LGGEERKRRKGVEFMYLIWEGGQDAEPSERGDVMQEMLRYVGDLASRGKLKGGAPLRAAENARTVRKRGGHATAVDGPYAETKEVVGGYFLVEADSLEEAVELAKGCSEAAFGGIEVREILQMG
jgi:hypothetical protein